MVYLFFIMNLYPHQEQMLLAMNDNTRGIIQCPTGGGKTFTFITDAKKHLTGSNVIVVVAPSLTLLPQLQYEFDKHLRDVNYVHREVSSNNAPKKRYRVGLTFRVRGEENPTTVIESIRRTYEVARNLKRPLILFSTYDSLDRITAADIPIEVTYYDEAHNATSSDKFLVVKNHALKSKRNYFFTATPKYGAFAHDYDGQGMNNLNVFGDKIAVVDFRDLVRQNVILLPTPDMVKSDATVSDKNEHTVNIKLAKQCIKHYEEDYPDTNHKILFCMKGSKIMDSMRRAGLVAELNALGYRVFTTTSSGGQYMNSTKLRNKDDLISQINKYGSVPEEKIAIFHIRQIAEGIDIKQLSAVVFARTTLNEIFTTQSIGRVLRTSPGKKRAIVTVVEHNNDTHQAMHTYDQVIKSLLNSGVPPESLINEDEGAAINEETIENLTGIKKLVGQMIIDWQWQQSVLKLAQTDPMELMSNV